MSLEYQELLVVDLDGTFLRSDMLHEIFWSAFSQDWRTAFVATAALLQGRAVLKNRLARLATVDFASLPYDREIISYIEKWRKAGGRIMLVTASDQAIADNVASHLGIFDDAIGSDGRRNLKGKAKGVFLQEHFGNKQFAYMGDATADVPVWQCAAKAITVIAPSALRQEVERVCDNVEHLETHETSLLPYVKALRPHQWLKNVLIFLPMLAAHQLNVETLVSAVMAFICFCIIASSVYVLNDFLDLSADRKHPRNCKRPFASGSLPIAHGALMAGGLLTLGAILGIVIGWEFALVMACYYVVTLAYSLHLKRRTVIDICVLAGLYTMRIIAGGYATEIPISVWLLAFSVIFFLALAAVKRQAELVDSASRGCLKASGRGYLVGDLPIISMIAIGAGYVSVLVLILYVSSPAVVPLYLHPETLWGVCAVLLYWITRMVLVAHRGNMDDDPLIYAARDGASQFSLIIILVFVIGGNFG